MLYGFRSDLAQSIANEGYHFTVYVPFEMIGSLT